MSISSFRHSLLLFLLLCAAPLAQAATSPVGNWDFVLADRQRGVAHVTFNEDGSIDGVAVLTSGSRTLTRTNRNFTYTNLFGLAQVGGSWVRENSGRLSGYINFISGSTTNGLSFRAVARSSRLTLQAFGSAGQVAFRGVPLAETNLVDLADGTTYLGTVRYRGVPFSVLEIFELTGLGPNAYEVAGGGPGYDYSGVLLISAQRQAAFYQDRGEDSGRPRGAAYSGAIQLPRRRGSWLGTDGVNTAIRYQVAPTAMSAP